MRIFNLSKDYNIVCNWQSTRYGFRHLATLHKDGFEIAKAKACYYNRTWERFEFETVMLSLINANFTGKEKARYIKAIEKQS
jgi:hypothetical protein